MRTAQKVAMDKLANPERYCPEPGCLWKTARLNHETQQYEGGGYCPRHKTVERRTAMEWFRSLQKGAN
jgi:hypothetical protein